MNNNLRIGRKDDILAEMIKPALSTYTGSNTNMTGYFILCAGFEERSTGFLDSLKPKNIGNCHIIIINYEPYMTENRLDEIKTKCDSLKVKHTTITYDRRRPDCIYDEISNLLINDEDDIYIDISAMSRLLVVQLIVYINKNIKALHKTTIIYSEAIEYPPSEEKYNDSIRMVEDKVNFETVFISTGVYEIFTISELSSTALQGQPIRLIAFPSFNIDQLYSLRTDIQPYNISLIHGIPPRQENSWRLEAIKELNNTDSIVNLEEYYVSTLDYRETLNCFAGIYKKYGNRERIIISPTGSKMQAVAIAIIRSFFSDIQIVYPIPREFVSPKQYTIGIRNIYFLKLDAYSEHFDKTKIRENEICEIDGLIQSREE